MRTIDDYFHAIEAQTLAYRALTKFDITPCRVVNTRGLAN